MIDALPRDIVTDVLVRVAVTGGTGRVRVRAPAVLCACRFAFSAAAQVTVTVLLALDVGSPAAAEEREHHAQDDAQERKPHLLHSVSEVLLNRGACQAQKVGGSGRFVAAHT